MSTKLNRKGEKYTTHQGYTVEIIEYRGIRDCDIKFESGFIINNVRFELVKAGKIRNPYHPSFYGVGYLGKGDYLAYSDNKHHKSYMVWQSMLSRCYSKEYQKRNTKYIGCLVDIRWHNYQNFAKWFYENYTEGYQLDKDILVEGNRLYCPERCCFVPNEINQLFTVKKAGKYLRGVSKSKNKFCAHLNKNGLVSLGVFDTEEEAHLKYREEKEKYIKEMADKHRPGIKEIVYKAMYNFKIKRNAF